MIKIDPLSAASVYLETIQNGNSISSATGFFYRKDDNLYLITNWHVVTNRDPISGRYRIGIAEPNALRFRHIRFGSAQPFGLTEEKLVDECGIPRWYIHPVHGKSIDVVALEVKYTNLDLVELTQHLNAPELDIRVGLDVFIIGFPLGNIADVPIWKRGTLATEPDMPVHNLPKMLVDSTTRPGMSGSPVLAVSSGAASINGGLIIGPERFCRGVGVYSGHLGNDEMSAELGIVWRWNVIEEIIIGRRLGSL
ncbi:MAG: serine protease [Aliidongia sp.]